MAVFFPLVSEAFYRVRAAYRQLHLGVNLSSACLSRVVFHLWGRTREEGEAVRLLSEASYSLVRACSLATSFTITPRWHLECTEVQGIQVARGGRGESIVVAETVFWRIVSGCNSKGSQRRILRAQ